MRVIAIDPSLTATGLAYVDLDDGVVFDWACVRTNKDGKMKATEDLARRLTEVAEGVRQFLAKHSDQDGRPKGVLVIEGQVGSSFGKSSLPTIFLLGAGYGACIGALGGLKPIVLPSATIKARLLGHREKTSKGATWQVAQTYFTEFPPDPRTKPMREAVRDAVTIAVAALPELNQLAQLAGRHE